MANLRRMAVGNGDTLIEETIYGVLLVYKWDARTNQYIAHTGDWASVDGVILRNGQFTLKAGIDGIANQAHAVEMAELDDLQATQDAASGRYGY